MKKWIIWACVLLLIVSLSLGIYLSVRVSDFLDGDGVHIWGECAHINLQRKCYFISGIEDTPNASNESIFTISGLVLPLKEDGSLGPFTGHMSVEKYPISLEDGSRGTLGYVAKDYIHIRNQAMLLLVDPECERWYDVDILRSDPDVIVIQIFHQDGAIVAVCGETKEEAMQNYQRYLDVITQSD